MLPTDVGGMPAQQSGMPTSDPLPPAAPPLSESRAADIADNLGRVLDSQFQNWREMRRQTEDGWIKDLRQFNGIYEADILANLKNRSKTFVRLTRTKTLSAYSRVVELMVGKDNNWAIDATPIPKLDLAREMELLAQLQQEIPAQLSQVPPDKLADLLLETEKDLAHKAAERMSTEIEDQLLDEKYDGLFKTATLEMALLGTGCIKGPVVKIKKTKCWVRNPLTGAYAMCLKEEVAPGLTAPSIFDTYPDPFCTAVEDGIGLYERHVMTAEHLRGMADYPGFDSGAIEEIIGNYPNGNHTDLQHEIDRREIAQINLSYAVNKRYDVMEYWGQVSGIQLSAAGLEVHADRMAEEIQANVWFCGARTIKVQLNPLTPERIPYAFCRYEKIPHQFWGIGVPRQMVDSQEMLNSSVRTILDNQAIASGPQLEVNVEMLADGEDPRDVHPWKVWLRGSGDPSTPMVRSFEVPSHLGELIQVAELFRKYMDEETSQPSYVHGETMPGLNKTASGMSMLMGAAQISTKGVVKNIDDDMVEPVITGMYDWNMRWNPRNDIKGDMQCKATGSTALLAKEMQSQRLMQYAQLTDNPVDAQLMGPEKRSNLLREIAMSLDLNPDEVAPDADQFSATGPAGGHANVPGPGMVAPGGGGVDVSHQSPTMGTGQGVPAPASGDQGPGPGQRVGGPAGPSRPIAGRAP